MDNETIRILNARLVAQQSVIELLLGILFVEKGPGVQKAITETLRKQNFDAGRRLGDVAAEYWADVAVRSKEQIERLIAAAERVVAADQGEG